MKLYGIRGGTMESFEAKEYNLCVGISLGNRWFTPENILGLIEWSLEYTKDYVVVCPADDIHAINLQVRNRKSPEIALKLARKLSAKLMASVKELVDARLDESQKSKIIYATWSDVADEEYKKKVKWLYTYFDKNQEFKNAMQDIVRSYTAKEERQFSNEEIGTLSTYILEELPDLVGQSKVCGYTYDADVYPHNGELNKLVEQIQLGKRFMEVRDKIMGTKPKVFLEVR